MSSTNKTANLGLNSWVGSDKPKREDFNYDNSVLDNVITEHINDMQMHITEDERALWNITVYSGMYFGNGSSTRTVETGCPFEASFVLVFANGRPLSVYSSSTGKSYNYIGITGMNASSSGIQLIDGVDLSVVQSSTPVISNEYISLNETGVSYNYIMFR